MSNQQRASFSRALVFISIACTAALAQQAEPTVNEDHATKTTAPRPSGMPKPSKVKVDFDVEKAGIVYIEANGERIRVDTTNRTFELVSSAMEKIEFKSKLEDPAENAPAVVAKQAKDTKYDFEKSDEPWDYRVVNIPTPRHVPKGTWSLAFTHRFTQELRPFSASGRNLLGLDSFGIASFGVTYGITDKLYATAYRSPLCRRGTCRTIEVGLGYNWIAQMKGSPIAFSTYASVEGNDNFTEEYTYNLQAMISARVAKRLYLFFSPAVHLNSNGQRRFNPRPNDFFPSATAANTFKLPTHGASFGFGAEVLITPNVAILFDFVPRTGFKMGTVRPVFGTNFAVVGFENESYPSIGFGIQRKIREHSFALTFSNTQATTTSRYNSSNLTLKPKDIIIGFNLSRRF
jgi:Membrane bound beta barrel domain (DUF5777)